MHGWYHYIKGYHLVVVLLALLSAWFLLFTPSPKASALTTVPTKMNFQGRLTDASGNIKPNGTYNMRLKLYTVSTAGSAVWSEDRLVSATQGVTLTNGLFSIQLGEITSLPASLFASGALYLEVELPTPATATSSTPTWTEGPMTPRNQMATSAYAYNAETIDGIDSANLAQLDANNTFSGNNIFTGTIQGNSSLTLGTAAAQGSLVVHDGNGQTATIRVADTAGSYIYTLPVTTANDTFCMLTLANCGGAGSGVTTVGTYSTTNTAAGGATISGTTIIFQDASATAPGMVGIGTQTFAGNKTFSGTLSVSSTATFSGQLTVGTADTTGILLVLDTKTNAGDPAGTAGAMYYNSSLGKFRCYQGAAWTDCIGTGGGGIQRVTLSPEYIGGVLTADGTNNNVTVTAKSVAGLALAQGYKHNFYEWDTTASTAQDYDIVVNYQLPSNFTSFVTGSFRLWTYADSLTSTDVTFMVKSGTDALCYASAVSVKPVASATWENKAPGDPGNGCTFAANDMITFVIKPTVIQPSTNKVKIGELRFEYQ